MTSVAVLGTGLLGTAIATRLLEQGLNVHVWNRNPCRIVPLVEKGATAIDDQGKAAGNDRVSIFVLRDGTATASVIETVGELQGSTIIPIGTMGIEESRKLATQLADQGGRYLEAPVLGSKPQALSGSLLVMAGGEATVFEAQQSLLSHLSQKPLLMGPVGSGAATKLALNQLIASLTHSFSLSLQLIQQAGVAVETFMAILRPSALYAPPPSTRSYNGCWITSTPIPTSAPPCCAKTCACSWRKRQPLVSKTRGSPGCFPCLNKQRAPSWMSRTTAHCTNSRS